MDQEQIRKFVENCFSDDSGLDYSLANTIAMEKSRSLVRMGIDLDADAICHIMKTNDHVLAFFVVGRSILFSSDAKQWLLDYHGHNNNAVQNAINEIANFAAQSLIDDTECSMPFKDSRNKAWRAFKTINGKGLKTVDDIRKRAKLRLS